MILPTWGKPLIIGLLIAGCVAALGVCVAGIYHAGVKAGKAECESQVNREERLVREAVDKAARTSADAISRLKIQNTTINQRVEREIQTNTVYRDCVHPDGVLRDINEALGYRADRPADRVVPTPDAAR